MAVEKPRLIYAASIERRRFFRRFLRMLFLTVVVAGAYWALREASRRGLANPLLLDVGLLVAIVLAGLLSLRGLYNLGRWLIRRSETVRVYDRGIVWERGRRQHKYAWHELVTYREAARGVYLGGLPLLQWGALRLTMRDGATFKFTGRFGDTRLFAGKVRRYAAYVTGIRLGRALRDGRSVQLHRNLTVHPGGVEINDTEITWAQLDVKTKNGRLIIRQRTKQGKFRPIAAYNTRRVDNVGGFLELSVETIRNHQPHPASPPQVRAQKAGARRGV